MKKKLLVLISTLMILLSLGGCSFEKATITTTVYPVKYLVEYLAGDTVNVQYLSTDDYIARAQISDNYDEILKNTTLLIYIGDLEPYLDVYPEVFENYNFEILNLASLSAINDFKRYTTVIVNSQKIIQENRINFYEDELFEDIDVYSKDPFIWLDPIAMSSMASSIKNWLQDYYPSDALKFENRFKTLQQQLVRMDVEFCKLNEAENIKLVSVAPTFGNWQKSYGVEVYPLMISKYGVLPSEEQIVYIEQQIKNNKVKYIVYDETLTDEDLINLYKRVKDDCSLQEIKLSSLSTLSESDKEANKDYLTIMFNNLAALESAFIKQN